MMVEQQDMMMYIYICTLLYIYISLSLLGFDYSWPSSIWKTTSKIVMNQCQYGLSKISVPKITIGWILLNDGRPFDSGIYKKNSGGTLSLSNANKKKHGNSHWFIHGFLFVHLGSLEAEPRTSLANCNWSSLQASLAIGTFHRHEGFYAWKVWHGLVQFPAIRSEI